MLTKTYQIKTTRNISKPLWQAIKDNQVADYDMVDWSKQFNQEFGGVKYE